MKIFGINSEDHQRRFDRGGVYVNYLTGFGMVTILTKLFNATQWWIYDVGIVLLIFYRYIMGYVEERTRLLHRYNKRNSEVNPFNLELMDRIKRIESKLYPDETLQG